MALRALRAGRTGDRVEPLHRPRSSAMLPPSAMRTCTCLVYGSIHRCNSIPDCASSGRLQALAGGVDHPTNATEGCRAVPQHAGAGGGMVEGRRSSYLGLAGTVAVVTGLTKPQNPYRISRRHLDPEDLAIRRSEGFGAVYLRRSGSGLLPREVAWEGVEHESVVRTRALFGWNIPLVQVQQQLQALHVRLLTQMGS